MAEIKAEMARLVALSLANSQNEQSLYRKATIKKRIPPKVAKLVSIGQVGAYG